MTHEKPSPENDKNEEKSKTVPSENKKEPVKEYGGRGGLEPTRYGDWEKDGKCSDF